MNWWNNSNANPIQLVLNLILETKVYQIYIPLILSILKKERNLKMQPLQCACDFR